MKKILCRKTSDYEVAWTAMILFLTVTILYGEENMNESSILCILYIILVTPVLVFFVHILHKQKIINIYGIRNDLKYIFILVMIMIAMSVLSSFVFAYSTNYNKDAYNYDVIIGVLNSIVYFINISVFHPLLEEYVFRYLIVFKLFKFSKLGIFISSLAFAYVHANPGYIFFVDKFISGLLFSFVYYKTKNLLPSIIGHSFFNGIIALIGLGIDT